MKQEAEFLEHLSKLQRYFKKPKTRQRARRGVSECVIDGSTVDDVAQVPSLPMLLVNAITFRFADTSEGKVTPAARAHDSC